MFSLSRAWNKDDLKCCYTSSLLDAFLKLLIKTDATTRKSRKNFAILFTWKGNSNFKSIANNSNI